MFGRSKKCHVVWSTNQVSISLLICSGIGDSILEELGIYEVGTLEFEDKRKWFRNGLELLRIPWTEGFDLLQVERSRLIESSMKNINKCLLYKVHCKLARPTCLIFCLFLLGGKNRVCWGWESQRRWRANARMDDIDYQRTNESKAWYVNLHSLFRDLQWDIKGYSSLLKAMKSTIP